MWVTISIWDEGFASFLTLQIFSGLLAGVSYITIKKLDKYVLVNEIPLSKTKSKKLWSRGGQDSYSVKSDRYLNCLVKVVLAVELLDAKEHVKLLNKIEKDLEQARVIELNLKYALREKRFRDISRFDKEREKCYSELAKSFKVCTKYNRTIFNSIK